MGVFVPHSLRLRAQKKEQKECKNYREEGRYGALTSRQDMAVVLWNSQQL